MQLVRTRTFPKTVQVRKGVRTEWHLNFPKSYAARLLYSLRGLVMSLWGLGRRFFTRGSKRSGRLPTSCAATAFSSVSHQRVARLAFASRVAKQPEARSVGLANRDSVVSRLALVSTVPANSALPLWPLFAGCDSACGSKQSYPNTASIDQCHATERFGRSLTLPNSKSCLPLIARSTTK